MEFFKQLLNTTRNSKIKRESLPGILIKLTRFIIASGSSKKH